MILTEEMIKNLPLSDLPEDYDNVEEITNEIIREFDEACDEIDREYANKSDHTPKFSDQGKD